MVKKTILWAMAVSGTTILLWVAGVYVQAQSAFQWPHIKGKVLSSDLTIDHLPKLLDSGADPLRWYGAQVRYQYTVNGWIYVSSRVMAFDSLTRSPSEAMETVNKYRKKTQVWVFYDPADPQRSVLEPGKIGDVYALVVLGVVLMLVGLVFLFDRSWEFNPPVQEDYLQVGKSHQRWGKYQQALDEYNKAIEQYPTLAQGYKARGTFFAELEEWDLAIADFSKAIYIDPADASLYFRRAKAHYSKKEYANASADAEKALEKGFKISGKLLAKLKGWTVSS